MLQGRLGAALDATQAIWRHDFEQPRGPRAVFLQIDDQLVIEQLATDLEIRYEYSIALRIADLLPPIDSYLQLAVAQSAPPHEEAEVFDTERLQWLPAALTDRPGAYRYKVFGAPWYQYISPTGSVHRMDQDLSVYAVLRDARRCTLRWDPEPVNGTLAVSQGAALPMLHGRAAALCSGLAPTFDVHARAHKFVNVPIGVAQKIAASLGQVLASGGGGTARLGRVGIRPAGNPR
jgi:hypothetical protein